MEYNEIIRSLREDRDLNQTQMGELIGVSQRTISQYETKGRILPIEQVIKYAKIFRVSTDYILGLSKYPMKSWLDQ